MKNSARIGVSLILIAVVILNSTDRYRIAPAWFEELVLGAALVAMLAAALTRSALWHRIELVALWSTILLGLLFNTVNLGTVIDKLVFHAVQPSTLFFTAVTIWINNVLVFTLFYWMLDGGGPDARARGVTRSDFDFPAQSAPEKVGPNWTPGLADYFFLGFTTATAFSPTEAQPLTSRAKLLMVAESVVSLTNIAVVAARAINIIQ